MSCVVANLTQKQTHQFNKKKTDLRQTKKQSSLHSCSESLLKWPFCSAGISKIIYTSPWLYLLIVVFFLALIYTGMWNQIFLGSYMSLFVAIPFAYFFMESEGFAGSRKVNYVYNWCTVTGYSNLIRMLNTVVSGLSANSGSLGFVLGTGGKEGVKASFWSAHTGNKQVLISHYPNLLFHFLHLWVLFPFLYYITLNINDNYKNVTSWVIHAFWLVLSNDLSEKRYRHDINIDNI